MNFGIIQQEIGRNANMRIRLYAFLPTPNVTVKVLLYVYCFIPLSLWTVSCKAFSIYLLFRFVFLFLR